MKWSEFTRHWLLVAVLGVAVGLTAISCGSGDDDKVGSADSTAMGGPGDVSPDSDRDAGSAATGGDVMTLFTTKEGDHGTIRMFPGAPNEMLIPLMQYKVYGSAPSGSIHNDIIDPNTNVQINKIEAYGGAPPWPGPQMGPGITDQPVVVQGVNAD